MRQGYCPKCGSIGAVNKVSGWMRMHRCLGGHKANGGVCVRFLGDPPPLVSASKANYIAEGIRFGALRFECRVPRTLTSEQVAEVRAALRRISEEMDRVYDDRRDMFGARQVPGTGVQVEIIKDFLDRKSTRLNSSHITISYAVFCLK